MRKYIFSDPEVVRTLDYAIRAHSTQTRKDGSTLYITHPVGVAEIVAAHGGDLVQVQAALLHDVIEDCEDYGYDEIFQEFGDAVGDMVENLTNTSKLQMPHSNRAQRKEFDAKRLATIGPRSQLVKLCDIFYNVSDLQGLDRGFIPKFLREKRYQVETMCDWDFCRDLVDYTDADELTEEQKALCNLRDMCLNQIQLELDRRK